MHPDSVIPALDSWVQGDDASICKTATGGEGCMTEVPGTQEVHVSTHSGMEKHSQAELGLERGARVRLNTAVQGLGSKGRLSKCL